MENKELIPVIQVVDGKIQDNLDVLETKVKAIAEQYKGLVVTDISDAKKTLANLRGLFNKINDEKITAKKIFMAPFEEVEKKIKEFKNILDEPIIGIDQQIKESEQQVREERGVVIDALLDQASIEFDAVMKEFFNSTSWRKDPAWLQEKFWTPKGNPTTKLKEEIGTKVNTCRDGILTILSVAGEFTDQILDAFKTSGNLGQSLSLLEEKKRAKEQAEAFTKSVEQSEIPVAEVPTHDEIPSFMKEEDLPSFMTHSPSVPQKKEVLVRFLCTDAEFMKVRSALSIAGIAYEVL
ncbi:DUF1351 domain-containing protein [Pleomorphochaeta sp. DL1XJH-081]|uniref:DUF1351 domain-containing protein n=1 Tax=Pleomorphochaeta sp. DL1XJH-081 TaxID=3409690 RepID=UPI003BB7B6D0